MKGVCISFLIVAIIVLSVTGICLVPTQPKTEYLRIHVRADSNGDSDQAVKYLVKDAVVEYLTPFISECDTKKKAESMLKERLDDVEEVANRVLTEKGFTYGCNASIRNEKFPTRKYGDLSLESGFYDALILELGSGKGDNWWCVVYPPLCFTGEVGGNYEYRSKIKEIIDEFYRKKGETQ